MNNNDHDPKMTIEELLKIFGIAALIVFGLITLGHLLSYIF